MIVRFVSDFPDDKNFDVYLNGQNKSIGSIDKEVVFELSEANEYKVKIIEEESFNNHTFLMMAIFIVTAIFQGLVHIVLCNNDSEWYYNITPYLVSAEFNVYIDSDQCYVLDYENSRFDKTLCVFSKPSMFCNRKLIEDCTYKKNYIDFYNQYYAYAKRFLSVVMLCEIMFTALLLVSIFNNIFIATIFCTFLIIGFVIVSFSVLYKEYKRLKLLLMRHKENN